MLCGEPCAEAFEDAGEKERGAMKGTITLDMEGRKSTVGPGSDTMIPGGVPHTPTCSAGAACEYFEHLTGAFDSAAAK